MRSDHLPAAENPPCFGPHAPSGFAEMVDGYTDRLVRFAFRRLGSIQDAEDIVHDVFVRIFTAERHDSIVLYGPQRLQFHSRPGGADCFRESLTS